MGSHTGEGQQGDGQPHRAAPTVHPQACGEAREVIRQGPISLTERAQGETNAQREEGRSVR